MAGQFASDLRDKINALFISKLEQGVKPWECPWKRGQNGGLPTSVSTRKKYRGINSMILHITQEMKEYDSKYWATYDQWKKVGACVNKGEKSTTVVLYKPCNVKDQNGQNVQAKNRKGEMVDKTYALMRAFWLFNVAQVSGQGAEKFRYVPLSEDINESGSELIDYMLADELILNTGADITHKGERACYFTNGDNIMMPLKKTFKSSEDYYTTMFHELGHWSQKRVSWEGSYSYNELVVDIAAVYVAGHLNLPLGHHIDNHASYIDGWLKEMKDDNTVIFKATSQASKVADYLLGFVTSVDVLGMTVEVNEEELASV